MLKDKPSTVDMYSTPASAFLASPFSPASWARIAGNRRAYTARTPAMQACCRVDAPDKPNRYRHEALSAFAESGLSHAACSSIDGGFPEYSSTMLSTCSRSLPMPKLIPEILKDHILPFNWDVNKVWALEAQVHHVSCSEFEYLLELPLWSSVPKHGLLFDIRPIDVIRDPHLSIYQTERINQTKLEYPGESHSKVITA